MGRVLWTEFSEFSHFVLNITLLIHIQKMLSYFKSDINYSFSFFSYCPTGHASQLYHFGSTVSGHITAPQLGRRQLRSVSSSAGLLGFKLLRLRGLSARRHGEEKNRGCIILSIDSICFSKCLKLSTSVIDRASNLKQGIN